MSPEEDKKLIEILRSRDAKHTLLELSDGRRIDVWNIAWGYDLGDDFAHVTTNISPDQPDYPSDFVYTHEVKKVSDAETGVVIIEFR